MVPNVQLALGGIRKTFSPKGVATPVLADVSFDIHERDFVSVIEPSGCGKPPMLSAACGSAWR